MNEVDFLANGLVSGEISCEGCGDLSNLVEQVRAGKISMEEFKKILTESKINQVKKVI